MKKYKVYHSNRFIKELSKCDKNFQDVIDKIEDSLSINPYTGKPLGMNSFREKKYEKFRVYFLIYEEFECVFMVAISEKKDQQRVINTIKLFLNLFREEIIKLIEKDNNRIT